MDVKDRLRELREGKGLSQSDMAQLMGKAQSTVAKYETGKSQADYDTLEWYADHFNVSMDWIFGRVSDPQTIKISPPSSEGLEIIAKKGISDERKALFASPEFAEQVLQILEEAKRQAGE